jgi:4-amino-4-deoxy-L-arabinose transferase-like glycosyltransferase
MEISGPTKTSAKWDTIVLFFLVLIHTSINIHWLQVDTLSPSWDESVHLIASLDYLKIMENPEGFEKIFSVPNYPSLAHRMDIAPEEPAFPFVATPFYPPFFYISTLPFYKLFGVSKDIAVSTNLLYFALLLVSTYHIGNKIFNREIGLLGAFFLSFYTPVYGISRLYLLDLALMSLVSLGVALLISTRRFERRLHSALFGLVLGIGTLTKWSYPVFLAGPVFVLIFKKGVKRTNLALAIIIGILISGYWYLTNASHLISSFASNFSVIPVRENDPEFGVAAILYYIFGMMNYQLNVYFFALFLGGLVGLSKTREKDLILLGWMLFSIGIFTLVPNKSSRYILPVLPAVALISAHYVLSQKRKLILMFSVILAFSGFMVFTFGCDCQIIGG